MFIAHHSIAAVISGETFIPDVRGWPRPRTMVGNAIIHVIASRIHQRHAPSPPMISCGLFVFL